MEQEVKEIRPRVQFAIYFVADCKEMRTTGDFQPGQQQEHLHNKISNKESSQCALLQTHKMLIIEHNITWKRRAT
jgi:hypothetical protein